MHMSTRELFVAPEAVRHAEPVNTAAWKDVAGGLYGILTGHALILGSVVAAGVLIGVAVAQLTASHSHEGIGNGLTLVIVGAALLGLLVTGGYGLILRSLWVCLRSAPEQCGAKWWMFAAILCITAGPALGIGSAVAGDDGAARANADGKRFSPTNVREAILKARQVGVSPIRLTASIVSMLSSVFFVLFLRSVALSFDDGARARFAELYLLFTAVLYAGGVGLFVVPDFFLSQPMLLLLLAGGSLLSGVWYLALIVSTCTCIQSNLAALRSSMS